MRILMLPTQSVGVSGWRFNTPGEALIKAGHGVTIFGADDYAKVIKDANGLGPWLKENAADYDIIHTGYSHDEAHIRVLAWARQEFGCALVTDIDDNYKDVPPYNPGFTTYNRASLGYRVTRFQLKISDGVTFSTPDLAEVCAEETGFGCVFPNRVSLKDWEHPIDPFRREDKSVRLILTGGTGRYGDWQLVREALETLMTRYDGKEGKPMLRLLFFGGTPDWVLPWMSSRTDPTANRCFYIQPTIMAKDLGNYRSILQRLSPDISLAPVLDNRFNACKSSIKAGEAGLCGAAFICTDSPTYAEISKDVCLKVSNTTTQWVESVAALVEDPALRVKKQVQLRDWVRENYTIEADLSRRVAFYEEVLARQRVNLATVA